MSARQLASTTRDRLRLAPIVELLSGRTVYLELLDGVGLDDAVACAGVWRELRPDVRLVVPLPVEEPVDRVRHALDRGGLEPAALAVEVPTEAVARAAPGVEALGVGLVVRAPGTAIDDVRRLCRACADLVKVPACPDLGAAVAAARRLGDRVVVTGVSSIMGVGDAVQAGADAAQGDYLGAELADLGAVLAHLAEEHPIDRSTVQARVAGLEARAALVEALVEELSDAGGRGAGSAGPRSGRSGPPGA